MRHKIVTSGGLVVHRPGIVTREKLEKMQRSMIDIAEEVMRMGVNEVDDILVGAALRTSERDIITGSNRKTLDGTNIHAEKAAYDRIEGSGFFNVSTNGILTVAVMSTYSSEGNDFPKFPCDACSLMLFKKAASSGVRTQIVMGNTNKTLFYVTDIVKMFGSRNIPEGIEYRPI